MGTRMVKKAQLWQIKMNPMNEYNKILIEYKKQ